MGVSMPSLTSPALSRSLSLPLGPDKAQPPAWRPDAASDSCLCCGKDFSMWVRRHHCRACGELVCGDCSPFWGRLPELGYKTPVRVCKHCNVAQGEGLAASASTQSLESLARGGGNQSLLLSDSSSDGEMGDIEEELVFKAVEVIALNSRDKRSKLMYQYFVQSEAVSWLVDAGLMRNRTGCAALFLRLVDTGYVTVKPAFNGGGSARAAFYILSDEVCLDRVSQYGTAIHSDTVKCSNCSRSFLKSMTSTPGFCSIDCKTNAIISQSDSAKIRRYVTG